MQEITVQIQAGYNMRCTHNLLIIPKYGIMHVIYNHVIIPKYGIIHATL